MYIMLSQRATSERVGATAKSHNYHMIACSFVQTWSDSRTMRENYTH